MRGYIRTRETCPDCGKKFELYNNMLLACKDCMQTPNRVYIEICWLGKQYKIYSDTDGRPLKTYEHASRVLAEIRQKIDKHRFDPMDYVSTRYHKLQFSSYCNKWLSYWQKSAEIGECSHLTYRMKEYMARRYFMPFFKDIDIRDIRPGEIEDFMHQLPNKIKPSTKVNIMHILKSLLNWARKRRNIKYVPEFPRIRQVKKIIVWAETDVQDRILEHIPDRHKPIFMFILRHGCRPGEARALQWQDINWHERTVTIRRTYSGNILKDTTKTNQERVLPLDDGIYAMLKQKMTISGFIFTHDDGKPYKTRTTLNYAWDKACKAAGIDHISLYAGTRHSFASQAVNKGVDLYTIQRFLGHTNPKTTQKYAHIETDGLRIALRDGIVKEFKQNKKMREQKKERNKQ